MLRILSRLHVKEPPKFTNRPPTVVGAIPGTNVTLYCEASGSPRPNVEWFQAQKSSVSFPVFQEDGCLQIKMVKEDVDFICRAKNSFGLAETTTTVIAEVLGGIIYYFCCEALKICSWKVVSLVLIARYVC
ncbi:unnamed protein product [Pocillopora meandrina]|uniref:Ig-like domain-containing protein n=1 Tax=Pocillopora meandrina TaxID=46732 RepID=A0AAU9XCQ0_9CNID|nr:unnamed protein product [Pocillopora meandrina]